MTKTDIIFSWTFALLGWALMIYSQTIDNLPGGQLFCLVGGVSMVLASYFTMPPIDK